MISSRRFGAVRVASVLQLVLFLGFAAAIAGCGGTKKETPLVKVSGKVLLAGAPLPMGTVEFHPDSGRGNNSKLRSEGMIKSGGVYTLITDGREGAPAGWYKVAINAKGMPDMSMMESGKAPTPPVINSKYSKPDSSGFSVEVKDGAAPGSYDFSLVK
jgi:hypothetical protein